MASSREFPVLLPAHSTGATSTNFGVIETCTHFPPRDLRRFSTILHAWLCSLLIICAPIGCSCFDISCHQKRGTWGARAWLQPAHRNQGACTWRMSCSLDCHRTSLRAPGNPWANQSHDSSRGRNRRRKGVSWFYLVVALAMAAPLRYASPIRSVVYQSFSARKASLPVLSTILVVRRSLVPLSSVR